MSGAGFDNEMRRPTPSIRATEQFEPPGWWRRKARDLLLILRGGTEGLATSTRRRGRGAFLKQDEGRVTIINCSSPMQASRAAADQSPIRAASEEVEGARYWTVAVKSTPGPRRLPLRERGCAWWGGALRGQRAESKVASHQQPEPPLSRGCISRAGAVQWLARFAGGAPSP